MSYIDSSTQKVRTTKTKSGRVLIMQSTSLVLGSEVSYRFYRTRRAGEIVYMIYAGYKRERVYCYAGGDRAAAESVYTAVVRGHVTPCTLPFIIEDMIPDPAAREAEAAQVFVMSH